MPTIREYALENFERVINGFNMCYAWIMKEPDIEKARRVYLREFEKTYRDILELNLVPAKVEVVQYKFDRAMSRLQKKVS